MTVTSSPPRMAGKGLSLRSEGAGAALLANHSHETSRISLTEPLGSLAARKIKGYQAFRQGHLLELWEFWDSKHDKFEMRHGIGRRNPAVRVRPPDFIGRRHGSGCRGLVGGLPTFGLTSSRRPMCIKQAPRIALTNGICRIWVASTDYILVG